MTTVRFYGLCLMVLLFTPACNGVQEYGNQPASTAKFEAQMQFEGGLVQVPVSVNGSLPKPFILDTGSNNMILSKAFADEVGAIFSDKTVELMGVGGDVTPVEVVRSLLVDMGGLQWATAEAMVPPESLSQRIAETRGQPFHGILGAQLFDPYVVTVDFQRQQLKLSQSQSFRYEGPGEIVKLSFKGRKPYIKATIQHQSDSPPIEGELLLDLGSNQALDLRGNFEPSITQGLPTRIASGLGGEVQLPMGRIHSLTLGNYEVSNPIVAFEPSKQGAQRKFSGRIGTQILSQFKIIFNYAKKQVIFEPLTPISTPIETDMSGLRLVSTASSSDPIVTVDYVYPNTPAQEAGILKGDRLLEIDGRPVAQVTLNDIRTQLMGVPGSIREVLVSRGETVLKIQIPLRRLI